MSAREDNVTILLRWICISLCPLIYFFFHTLPNKSILPVALTPLTGSYISVPTYIYNSVAFAITRASEKFQMIVKSSITQLRLLLLVIGLKILRNFSFRWEAKSKPFAPCTWGLWNSSAGMDDLIRLQRLDLEGWVVSMSFRFSFPGCSLIQIFSSTWPSSVTSVWFYSR